MQETTMLRIDTAGLSSQDLEEIVAEHCSLFGTVKKVTVCTARPGSSVRPFALVYMQTLDEARRLAAAFSRGSIGLVVVIPFASPVHSFAFPVAPRPAADGNLSASK
jgi:hypothetical protein